MDASTKSEHHIYHVRPRKDHRGVDLISDALPFGRLWYGEPEESRVQSTTRSFASDYTTLRFAFAIPLP